MLRQSEVRRRAPLLAVTDSADVRPTEVTSASGGRRQRRLGTGQLRLRRPGAQPGDQRLAGLSGVPRPQVLTATGRAHVDAEVT